LHLGALGARGGWPTAMTDHRISVEDQATDERRRAATISLYGGVVVLVGKAAAYSLTGSTAVLSDALESVVNVVAAAFLLYSIRLASTPADRNHPYGHGKIEFFSAGVEGTLIAFAAGLILFEAIGDIWRGPELHRLNEGMLVLAFFGAINAGIGLHLVRVGNRLGSLALRADGMHLLTDVITTLGVLIGLLAVKLTGWSYLDPIAAVIVALNILRVGWQLAREAVSGLMDEADEALLEQISVSLESQRKPWSIDIHTLRTWRSGATHHVDLHMTVPRYYDAERLHEVDEVLGVDLFEHSQLRGDMIVHFDPCRPRHCTSCAMEDCPVRSHAFEERAPYSVGLLTRIDEDLDEGRPLREDAV
jgi:cation diffusion facilitator family transporter